MAIKTYYVYILTNKIKTVLYTGVTNNLCRRLQEHKQASLSVATTTFTGRYNVFYLLYFEQFPDIKQAIAREKEIKGWNRGKKMALINTMNPDWHFLNEDV